jgi:SAM-dependent methyltransferase
LVQNTDSISTTLTTTTATVPPIAVGSFRKLLSKLPKPAKTLSLLDVGCGQGNYLPFFAPDSVGLELSDTELHKCCEKNLTVYKWSFTDTFPSELAGRQFDAAMLSHFLEHVFSPHLVLLETRKYLKSEGLLIIHCPIVNPLTGISDRLARRYGWQKGFHGALFGDHINFFTATTLRYTCEMAGFKTLYLGSPYLPNFLAKLLLPFWPSAWLICQKIDNYQYNHESCKSLDEQGNIFWRI